MSDRTLRALDWDAVVDALALHARTRRGAVACRSVPLATTATEVRARYAEVAEVLDALRHTDDVPVGGVLDVEDAVARASRGASLEAPELREIGTCLRALVTLRAWSAARRDRYPRLDSVAEAISVDPPLLELLESAFDGAGELSERTWPELGVLRRRVGQLRDRIRSTLDDIVRGDDWSAILQDRFVSERDGRFVVPVKMAARKGLGIVHDTSHSGETAFVEPAAVVELHNELREVESELRRTERRILAELSAEVGRRQVRIHEALHAATAIDLACARAGLGLAFKGEIPTVGTEGVIRLLRARHPLLALRGNVVPNDLALLPQQPALVLTGPNAGGKTIALKTIGLAALLVRAAIPIPAAPESRVDVFDPVVADVGDMQSVEGGLSTFSAHVGALRAAIDAARPGGLVLLDEIAVGTDPAQGAALARAVLEAVVDGGARVAVTTHYPELKTLGAADPRFAVAAAQYHEGRPTYRLEMGAPGASYALAMAKSLGLSDAVVARARDLLDASARELADRLERLSEERALWQGRVRELESREAAVAERERKLGEREERIDREGRKAIDATTEAWRAKLRKREEQVRQMVATLQAGGDLRDANRTLAEVRAVLAEGSVRPAAPPPAPPAEVALGETVRIRSIGQKGRVVGLGDQVEIEVGRVRMRVPRTDLERAGGQPVVAVVAPPPPERVEEPVAGRLRTSDNTCDLRGMRVDEALQAVERFLDAATLGPPRALYVLHGHGTGALKVAVRQWLRQSRQVRASRPADADEGGDAYTVVELA